jgi:DNA-binding HxlR family transcriptional regulator
MRKVTDYTTLDMAIVGELRRNEAGLRYNALYEKLRKSSNVCIKTFNDHLKKLVSKGIVEKKEESKYKVTYKLRISEVDFSKLGIEEEEQDKRNRALSDMVAYGREKIIEYQSTELFTRKEPIDVQEMAQLVNNLRTIFEFAFARAIIIYQKNKNISSYIIDEMTNDLNILAKEIVEYSQINPDKKAICIEYSKKAANTYLRTGIRDISIYKRRKLLDF